MSWEEIGAQATKLKRNQRPSPRPHKPLLLLYALGRWRAGEQELPFALHMDEFDRLVRQCGADSASGSLDDPFWLLFKTERLLWEVTWDGPFDDIRRDPLVARDDRRDWRPGAENLRAWNAYGKFPPAMQQLLRDDPGKTEELTSLLLTEKYFPNCDLNDIRILAGL